MNTTNNWEKAILRLDALVSDAIKVLNEASLRIVLVIDSNNKLVGTISDGDVRRGILRGVKFSDSLMEIIHLAPVKVSEDLKRSEVISLMLKNEIFQIPIVDTFNRVVGLHLWDKVSIPIELKNPFVIMAGGKGTRLLPRTEFTPKPMLKIKGKPIIEHIILKAKKEGFRNFVIAIHHLGEVIEEYFGDGSSLNVNIHYLREEYPLGTAGALQLIQSKKDETLIVTNGDLITDVEYVDILEFHRASNADATMAVQMYELQNPFGVVETSGIEIVNYEEKPVYRSMINAGVYVLESEVLSFLSHSEPCDMPELFEVIRKKGKKSVAFPIHESWSDLGRPADFERIIEEP